MIENINYKINEESIGETFKFSENSLTHKQGVKYKMLPYAANEKTLVSSFEGVVGAFSRLISNKEIKSEFNVEEFIEDVASQIGDYEGATSKDVFKDIVKTMFINDKKLVDFDIKTINYITSTSAEEKVAKFLYSVLFDTELKEETIKKYDKEVDNILYKLVLKALPDLKDKDVPLNDYECYMPFIRELFVEDFKFLIKHEEIYKNSLKRFLEYYYMFYVSQLCMKLNKFDMVDINVAEPLYYTLSWESTSKNRTAYKFGWNKLKNDSNSLFAHAITLEFLNHHDMDKQFGYKQLAEIYNSMDKDEIESQIESIFINYTSRITDKTWKDFNIVERNLQAKGFNKVSMLFDAIEYQFVKSSRSRANESYRNWFIKFVYDNFSKKRGPLGYNLNMTEDDIILMTKICIKEEERLKLNILFEEFKKRGLFFDRDSKVKIVQLYEKLNLLEKKSDSGDAQYVRSVL